MSCVPASSRLHRRASSVLPKAVLSTQLQLFLFSHRVCARRRSVVVCSLIDRSRDGARWVGDVLVRALGAVSERHQSGDGDDGGGGRGRSAQSSPPPGRPGSCSRRAQDGGGLQGVCRALFQHCCVVAIGYVEVGPLSGASEGEEGLVVSGGAAGVSRFRRVGEGLCLRGGPCFV